MTTKTFYTFFGCYNFYIPDLQKPAKSQCKDYFTEHGRADHDIVPAITVLVEFINEYLYKHLLTDYMSGEAKPSARSIITETRKQGLEWNQKTRNS